MNPTSLFPVPTPESVKDFVVAMMTGGVGLGRTIAEAVFVFIESLFVGLA